MIGKQLVTHKIIDVKAFNDSGMYKVSLTIQSSLMKEPFFIEHKVTTLEQLLSLTVKINNFNQYANNIIGEYADNFIGKRCKSIRQRNRR